MAEKDEHLVEHVTEVVEQVEPGVGGELLGEVGGDQVVQVAAAEVTPVAGRVENAVPFVRTGPATLSNVRPRS